jgi:phosphohistidine phosphatase
MLRAEGLKGRWERARKTTNMDLYLIRHAIAEDIAGDGHGADSERRLTSEGATKMRRIAKALKDAGLAFDLILSSPYVRARQTAEIVAKVYGLKKALELTPELAPHGNPRKLMELLANTHRKRRSVVLVGHEPYLSTLISLLLSGGTSLSVRLKKAGICKLTAEEPAYGQCATLEWLLTPRLARSRG